VARRPTGEKTVSFLLDRGRLESLGETDLENAATTAIGRATKRLRTATAALEGDDVDGAYAAAYDAYRMAAEALLVRQGLRATGGDGSHMTVEDAVGAQFAGQVSAFAKPTFERMRRTRHTAQYFDPSAPPIERGDAEWALEMSRQAVEGATELIDRTPPDRFIE
jgi:uncharacterized protein (UPF0332 family)